MTPVGRAIVQYAMGSLLFFDAFAVYSCARAVPVVNGSADGLAVPKTWEAAVHEHGFVRPWFLPSHHPGITVAIIGLTTLGVLASGRYLQQANARRVGRPSAPQRFIDLIGWICAVATFLSMCSHIPTIPAR